MRVMFASLSLFKYDAAFGGLGGAFSSSSSFISLEFWCSMSDCGANDVVGLISLLHL